MAMGSRTRTWWWEGMLPDGESWVHNTALLFSILMVALTHLQKSSFQPMKSLLNRSVPPQATPAENAVWGPILNYSAQEVASSMTVLPVCEEPTTEFSRTAEQGQKAGLLLRSSIQVTISQRVHVLLYDILRP